MPEIRKLAQKSAIRLAAYYAIVSLAIIFFASPLFRVLSFEYAALITLFGSLPVMWFAAKYVQEHRHESLPRNLWNIWLTIILPVLVPVIVSLILIRSCDVTYGLGYYGHVVIPSTIIATLLGAMCGVRSSSRRMRIFLTGGIWITTFVLSLLPGYVSQQIYTYGWQYGFFPGFIWDDYIELGRGYNAAMIGYFIIALAILILTAHKKKIASPISIGLFIFLIVFFIKSLVAGTIFFGDLTHNRVETKLFLTLQAGLAYVHFDSTLNVEEQAVLRHSIGKALEEIQAMYPQIDTMQRIHIYVYPTADELYEYVGTRRASIAKPWLAALHIAKENLSSLQHELVHLLLKPFGNFPFYSSWSTGLTEGAAIAAEEDYDGLRTVDQLSAWALTLHYASSVSDVMRFTGFASTASTTSYILTGSFAQYLIKHYGSEKFLSLYHTRDYEEVYGKSLEDLNAEWRMAITNITLSMSPADSLLAQYYFDRPAVVNQKCLRRIGRLVHEARQAYNARSYAEAFELFRQAYTEDSNRTDALRGMSLCKVKKYQFTDAVAVLDSSYILHRANRKVPLSDLYADIKFLAHGDIALMKARYDEFTLYAPNDVRFVAAVGLRCILEDSLFNVERFLRYRYGLDSNEKLPQALYEHPWESAMPDSVRVGYLLLRTLYNEARGGYSAAIHEWTALPLFVDPEHLSPRVRKAYEITDRKVRRWMQALELE